MVAACINAQGNFDADEDKSYNNLIPSSQRFLGCLG